MPQKQKFNEYEKTGKEINLNSTFSIQNILWTFIKVPRHGKSYQHRVNFHFHNILVHLNYFKRFYLLREPSDFP